MTAILKLYYIIVLRYHKYTRFIAIILTEPCADLVNKMVDARQAQLRSSSFTQRYGSKRGLFRVRGSPPLGAAWVFK